MNPATLAAQIVIVVALALALVLALIASRASTPARSGRHWFIVPVVVFVAICIAGAAAGLLPLDDALWFHLTAVALLLLIGVIGGSPLVLVVLELAGSGSVPLGDHGGILVTGDGARKPEREILRGGLTIGYLERLAVIGAALAGQYGAIAIVVAVKGLGRFSELENAAARERFIIGTLVSLIWAAACVAPVVLALAD